jgi:HK97 family phage portal protein
MFKALGRQVRDFLSSFSAPDNAAGLYGGTPSTAGVTVTELTAIQSPVVFACVRILSSLLAKTPLHVYKKLPDGGRTIAVNHPLEALFSARPNDEMSPYEYKETAMTHCVMRGNSYSRIERDTLGRIAGLYPLSPFNCTPYRDMKSGEIVYKFTGMNGVQQTLASRDVLHIKNISLEGLVGLTPIQHYAKEAVGLDIALRAYGSRFIANGGSASMALKFKGKISPKDRKDYERDLVAAHSGTNAHRAIVLDNGGDLENLSITPEEAQFLDTRGFQRDEIAECIYGVPSHLVGGTEETKAGIGEQNSALLANTMSSWFARWESALNFKLFPTSSISKWDNSDKFEIAFDTTDMDRYRIMETLKTVATGRQWGVLTGNDGRRLIGMNPSEGTDSNNPMDKYWRPVNMIAVSTESENA